MAQLAREGKLWGAGTTDAEVLLQTHALVGAAPRTRAQVELYLAQRGVTSKGGGQVAGQAELAAAKAAVKAAGGWLARPVAKILLGAGGLLALVVLGWVFFARSRRAPALAAA